MLGAIIGDLAGSIYEYEQIKKAHSVKINNIIEDNAFFSDDTILTIAIADAQLNSHNYGEKLKEYASKYLNYKPNHKPYFQTTFSPNFTQWVQGDYVGTSSGNGAMMRISPIGYLSQTEEDVIKYSRLATEPSHNDETAIKSATTIALIIFYLNHGIQPLNIISKLNLDIKKPEIKSFNYTCADTMDICLYSLFNAKSFEDSIRLSISFGGDTDTNACIVGSMAEALFGIPENLKSQALAKIPHEFTEILNSAYSKINSHTTTL